MIEVNTNLNFDQVKKINKEMLMASIRFQDSMKA
jgi:hypothetical protein